MTKAKDILKTDVLQAILTERGPEVGRFILAVMGRPEAMAEDEEADDCVAAVEQMDNQGIPAVAMAAILLERLIEEAPGYVTEAVQYFERVMGEETAEALAEAERQEGFDC